MANASQDLVIRMKTDSQNFNEGIEAAKGKVKDFKREGEGAGGSFEKGMKAAKAAIGKIAIAVGAATAAIKTFKSFADQSQTWGDELNNTIDACKTTFQNLQREILIGGTITVNKLREMYEEAYKLAELKDELGTLKITQQWKRGQFLQTYNEARAEYAEAKQNKDKEGMAKAAREMNKALHEYANNSQKIISNSQKTTEQILKANGVGLKKGQTVDELIDEFVAAQEGELMPITKLLKEISNRTRRTYGFGGSYTEETIGLKGAKPIMKNMGYSDAQIAAAERQLRMSELTDPTLLDAITTRLEGKNIETEISNYRRTNARTLKPDTEITANTTTIVTDKANLQAKETQSLIPQLQPRKFSGKIDISPNSAKPLDDYMVNNWMAEYEYEQAQKEAEEEERNKKWQKEKDEWAARAEKVKVYTQAIGGLSNAFSNLASIASDDSPWKKFMTVLASVGNNIMSLVQTYTSLVSALVAARVIESGQGIPFPYNLIVMGAAAASITGIIATVVSQAKSQKFAQGGIVGGNNYHDEIRANLSTGEMVLNKNQQARLWNLIISGGAGRTAENVVFKIYGEDLVGVIDNYNKNSNY